jgi:PKD repeat protein
MWEGKKQKKYRVILGALMVPLLLLGREGLAAGEPAVLINEIMWDGVEYVELYNTTQEEISLAGWELRRKRTGKIEEVVVVFGSEEQIEPEGFWLIEKTEGATEVAADKIVSGLTLLNSGEQLRLVNEQGEVVDVANREEGWLKGENTETGVAMERVAGAEDGTVAASWQTATGSQGGRNGTPRAANSEGKQNMAPEAVISAPESARVGEEIIFSGEDSSDPEGDKLTYSWNLGDGQAASGAEVVHIYAVAGTYVVTLIVNDDELEGEVVQEIEIESWEYSDKLIISRMVPNPPGADGAAELIEIKNNGTETVDLAGWQLDDVKDGGSRPYTIPAGITIAPGAKRVFLRSETRIALNNNGDTVRLVAPSGEEKFAASYTKAAEGEEFKWENGEFKGQAVEEQEKDDPASAKATADDASVAGESIEVVVLKEIRNYEEGKLVETEGVVSVTPGPLGEKIMYLAGSGVQVYFNDEEWPSLAKGDRVKIRGTLSSYLGETRVKLSQVGDVEVVGKEEEPAPHEVKTGEVGEEQEGSLVIVAGEVMKTSGDTFYVDDGSGDIKIFIKETTGIKKPKMEKGTKVTIIGVVSQTTTGYRILPRQQEDVRLGIVKGLSRFPATGLRSNSYGRQAGAGLLLVVAGWQLLQAWRKRERLLVW